MLILFSSISLGSQQIVVQNHAEAGKGGRNDFNLVANGSAADFLVDINDSKTVHLATRLFSEDIERVSGQKAEIKNDVDSASLICVIVGTLDHNRIIMPAIDETNTDDGTPAEKSRHCLN